MERRTFVRTLVLTSGTVLLGGAGLKGAFRDGDTVVVKMIYNNTGSREGMKNDWGLSVWVEKNGTVLLFDTGGKPDILLRNMATEGLDPARIKAVLISHNHWDHTGGLEQVLERAMPELPVYVPENDLEDFKKIYPGKNIKGLGEPMQILPGFYSGGQLSAGANGELLYEQALIIEQGYALFLFTGCSHPGIVKMVERAKEIFPGKKIALVAGGFHLLRTKESEISEISGRLRDLGVEKLAASHCTGDKAIAYFREAWKEDFTGFDLGDERSII
ncbi:MAG: MBL fold metallo-hydrolase [Bacteroidota bacterium]